MTRPIRRVIGKDLRFKYLSVTEDENRLCVRILLPMPPDAAHADVTDDEFFSTKEIVRRYYKTESDLYLIQAEGVFDRTSRLGRLWWEAGANIEFITDTYLANQGIIQVESKHRCAPNSLERSTEWLRRLGKQGLCQVYCRTADESIIDAAKSFTADEEGKTFCNLDTARIFSQTSEELQRNKDASSVLITYPVIQVPKEVAPYEIFWGRLTLLRGEDGRVATECTGDVWLIDAMQGVVINRKVTVKEGVGYFKARAMDLQEGETMEFTVADASGHVFARTQTVVGKGDEQ